MNSGIKPDEAMIEEYKNLKFGKEKVWILSIDIKENVLLNVFKGDTTFQYQDLADQLPNNEPRFVIIDFDYETTENPPRKTSKLLFFFWCPMASPATKRFIYSSSIAKVVSTLGAISKQYQFSDYSDLDYEEIRKSLLK